MILIGTTYTTSADCARLAGIKVLSANTFPATTDVDSLRDKVYSNIGDVIGYGTADSNGAAAAIESEKVVNALVAMLLTAEGKPTNYSLELTEKEEWRLQRAFASDGEDLGFSMFNPGANV